LYDEICSIVSEERFAPYLAAAGYKQTRALELYAWNMKVSASFYPLLAATEICLRNRIMAQILALYGVRWWDEALFLELLGPKGKGIVLRARNEICRRGQTPTAGRITAELSFGFWQKMLLPKYEQPLWNDMHASFPDLPLSATQYDLHQYCEGVRLLRNRISHHEPVFRRNLTRDYGTGLTLLTWLSPSKASWVRPQLQVMRILRDRP